MPKIPQFGEALSKCKERKGAYAVIFRNNRVLVLEVKGEHHLPGGKIEKGEREEEALVREVREETGYEIMDVRFLGRANQFFPKTDVGPLNKLGSFYTAKIIGQNPDAKIEKNHLIVWVELEELPSSSLHEFQKWAVEQALTHPLS